MILGQSHQDLTTLYNALKELTRRSEIVNKEKIRIQYELHEVIDELDILDDQEAESYGILEAKAGIEQLNPLINKLKNDYSYGYKSKED